jgi:hypothetical protein
VSNHKTCNPELNKWLESKTNLSSSISSSFNDNSIYHDETLHTPYKSYTYNLQKLKGNYYRHSVNGEEIMSGEEAGINAGKNIWLSRDKVTLEKSATLSAALNIYLFDSHEVRCTNSTIKAGGDLYMPAQNHVFLNNCMIEAKSINYIDDANINSELNSNANAGFNLFVAHCPALGSNSNIIPHDEL